MNYKALPAGRTVPTDMNALIEIAKGGGSIKYEFDRHSGALIVDRLRDSSMNYPVNYGCIPQTLSEDGDPLDVLVLCDPIQGGTVIAVRPARRGSLPWTQIRVMRCTKQSVGWEIGCTFVKTPASSIMMLFG